MSRKVRLAASRSVTGTSASASVSSCSFTCALAANSWSCSAAAASRAPKKASWAPRKRFQSASSTSRGAGPAAFHWRIRSRYRPAVGPHSVEVASSSASAASRSLTTRAASRFSCCSAKCALRRRVYAVRAVENRRQSASSDDRSMRGNAFHSSSSSRIRLAPLRQSEPSASCSASVTIRSLLARDSADRCARSALRASRCTSSTGPSASSRAVRAARSPTAFASSTWVRTVRTDAVASSGDITPDWTRFSSSSTSNASASKRSVKNFSASAGVPSGYWPTGRSPSAVLT